MNHSRIHLSNSMFALALVLCSLTCLGQRGPLRPKDINFGISMGPGTDHHYNKYPFLRNYEGQSISYVEMAISDRQMVGLQMNVDNRYFKSKEALHHFRNTLHPPCYTKALTRGYHVLHDFGFRYSTCYRIRVKRFYPYLFFRSTLSAGVHQTEQAVHGFIEYPSNPNLPPVRFGTRPDEIRKSPLGWFTQGIGVLEYENQYRGSYFIATSINFGRSINRVEYYEIVQQKQVVSDRYTEVVNRLALGLQFGLCGWIN